MFRINEELDGRKVNLAVCTFENFEEAAAFCTENNRQPGGHLYYIDPDDIG